MWGIARHPFFIRLFHWEYWSFGMVYSVVYPIWILLGARARSFFFFSAANPTIRNGGFLAESKKDIHALLPEHLYPPTIHFDEGTDPDMVISTLKARGFAYPVVGKPDTGGRGRGVKVLKNDSDVRRYVGECRVHFHMQKFIPLPQEAGIFYYRYPGEARGHISGIVMKEFLSVEADGVHTIRELLQKDSRALLQMKSLEKMYGEDLDIVLPAGQKKVMVPYGNHARGAKFIDHSGHIDHQLEIVIDDVCRQVDGFYFGRLDVRFNTWEELRQGKNFCMIEINGAGSEPTHIYDPSHSIFFAWKEIVRHWYILWKISRMNHQRGHRYLTFKEAMRMFREDRENSAKIEAMPE